MHSMLGSPHVYIYGAGNNRPYQTVVTMGLSRFRMPAPESQDNHEDMLHVELFTYLPPDWPIPSASGQPGYWPYEMLMSFASYAAAENVWLGPLHTIPNLTSSPYGEPFAPGTSLSHALLLPPVQENDAFDLLDIEGRRIRFLHVLPITSAECDAKVQRGFYDSLVEPLEDGSLPVVIDPHRKSCF